MRKRLHGGPASTPNQNGRIDEPTTAQPQLPEPIEQAEPIEQREVKLLEDAA